MIRAAAFGLLLLSLSSACSRPATDLPFTLRPIGSNIWAAIDNSKSKSPAGANAGFVIGDDGVAVIDTFADPEAARQLLDEIRKRTALPIKFAINTHYHLDHVAGNGVFANAGAVIVAQRNVRSWIHSQNLRLIGPQAPAGIKALAEGAVPPSLVFDQMADIFLGSRELQLRTYPGHTGGDAVVLIHDAAVVFAGDLLWHNMAPTMIDASTQPWIDTLDSLATDEAAYTFVPGHGDVSYFADVAAFREYLVTLRDSVAAAQAEGKSGDAVVAAVFPVLKERFGWWDGFDPVAKTNIRDTEAELAGTKEVPAPR